MTIFILTDDPQEARRIFHEKNIPWNNGNPMQIKEGCVVWIDDYKKIQGRKILNSDEIILGFFYDRRLKHELTLQVKMKMVERHYT